MKRQSPGKGPTVWPCERWHGSDQSRWETEWKEEERSDLIWEIIFVSSDLLDHLSQKHSKVLMMAIRICNIFIEYLFRVSWGKKSTLKLM